MYSTFNNRERLFRRFVAVTVIVFCMHLPVVLANSATLTPKKVVVGGIEGVWLPSDQMDKVRWHLEEREPGLLKLTEAQEQLIEAQKLITKTASTTMSAQNQLINEYAEKSKEQADLIKSTGGVGVISYVIGGLTGIATTILVLLFTGHAK